VNDRAYPARLSGELDPNLSRWLWIVKWFLAIPHYVVLFFLWFAALLMTIVAGFAILFTGRYPRSLFEFNIGVMRWTWRVSFYTIGAFGTDKYPPFSLDPDPTYPADFTVDYPEQLSRGLVLVKWWLLAIPQYLIVGVLAGGWNAYSGGLISLLVVIAGIILLFTGRYPKELFDLVMGFNRWCFRVLAYAVLMSDEYPPFRLDNGGADPGDQPAQQVPPMPPVTPQPMGV
jgi:hypothetical protein